MSEHERFEAMAQQIGDRSVSTWNAINEIYQDTRHALGGEYSKVFPIISSETAEFVTQLGMSDTLRSAILRTFLVYDPYFGRYANNQQNTALSEHFRILGEFEDDQSLEHYVRACAEASPQLLPFFIYVGAKNPVFGATTPILYEQSRQSLSGERTRSGENGLPQSMRLSAGWYKETVDKASETKQSIDIFFTELKDLASDAFEKSVVCDFLIAFQDDLNLNVVETLGMANSYASHLQDTDCAVYTGFFEVPAGTAKSVFEKHRSEINALWGEKPQKNEQPSLYWRYSQEIWEINQRLGPEQGYLLMPVYVSAVDVWSFFKAYDRFWKQNVGGIQSSRGIQFERDPDGDSASRIRLGNAVSLLLRPFPTNEREARISLEGRGNFSGFTIRVDDERCGNSLALDVGGVDYNQLLGYAQELGEQDRSGEGIFQYLQNVDAEGKFHPGRTLTILNLDNSQQALHIGNKAAIIVALAMKAHFDTDIRKGSAFSYHAREQVADSIFHDNFPRIVISLQEMLKRKKKRK